MTETTLVPYNPDNDEKVQALYLESLVLAQNAESTVITDLTEAKLAADSLILVNTLTKALDKERIAHTGPLNAELNGINRAFKDFTAPLVEAKEKLDLKIRHFKAKQEREFREAEAERKKAEEEAEDKRQLLIEEYPEKEAPPPVEIAVVITPPKLQTEAGTIGTQKIWDFEVTDKSLLPLEFLVPDMVAIRKKVIELKVVGTPIPGVAAWQKDGLRLTGNIPPKEVG